MLVPKAKERATSADQVGVPSTDSRRIRRLVAACLGLCLVLSAVGISLVRLEESQRSAAADRLLVAEAAEIRAALGDELSHNINLARGLRAFVIAQPDLGDPERFAVLLEQLYLQGDLIRNIGLAPGDVISHVHPLEGNEAALGLRYAELPEQYPSVDLAIRTRQSVLAGPVELVQGGRGLIDRTPVFLTDGSYWGVVSLVLDVDALLASVAEQIEGDLEWAVRTVAGETMPSIAVGGDPALFDDADTVLTLAVPNGTWELAARSTANNHNQTLPILLHLFAVVIAALISLLVFAGTRARWRATMLSLHDALTGLANRRLLGERADQAFAQARRRKEPLSLAYLDVDSLKPVNDTHGHKGGDIVLQAIAERLTGRVREVDTVARIGGDEFVILLPNTDSIGASAVARDLAAAVERPVRFGDSVLEIGASFGVATYPDDGETFDELLAGADSRMYDAKVGNIVENEPSAAGFDPRQPLRSCSAPVRVPSR